MTTLRSPSGSVIQASGRLEARLVAQGWEPTDLPASPGLRLVTAAELEAATAQVAQMQSAVAAFTPGLAPRVDALEAGLSASQEDRAEIHAILAPVQAEVDDLTATVQATTTQSAPKFSRSPNPPTSSEAVPQAGR